MEEEGRPRNEIQWLEHLDQRLQHIEGEIDGLTEWSERFEKRVDERFDQLELKLSQRIDDLEERMDRRFDDTHGAIRGLDRRVFQLERERPSPREAAE